MNEIDMKTPPVNSGGEILFVVLVILIVLYLL